MKAFEQATHYLEDGEKAQIGHLANAGITDIAIRVGRRPLIGKTGMWTEFGRVYTQKMLESLISRMLQHSLYAWEDELGNGYFTLPGGARVGVTGRFVSEGGKTRLASAYGIRIRVARQVTGCADGIVSFIDGRSALILSAPGKGKTTLLRDAARSLSNGGRHVCLIDERGELAACRDGCPTMDVGNNTDVCEGLSKADAAIRLIRSMAPDVIVMDEIGSAADADAIREAARMGVKVLASAHARDLSDAVSRRVLGRLMTDGAIERVILLENEVGRIGGTYSFDLKEAKWRFDG